MRPDLTWSWKDEGEFERGCPLGLISAADDAGVRAARDEVVGLVESRGGPFGPGFDTWRPDAGWSTPEVPPGVDTVAP